MDSESIFGESEIALRKLIEYGYSEEAAKAICSWYHSQACA